MQTLQDDQTARARALDITRSFIVQAPAGSGKTELLIQRYLALLATVNDPEEVIAITFTRKAAAEIKNRIQDALHLSFGEKPIETHKALTWELAKKVLMQEDRLAWGLLENTNRLRVLTIDALCASIAAQMPLDSGLGTRISAQEEATVYYREAARELFKTLEESLPWQASLEVILKHLNNNLAEAEDLISALLSKREQWLRHVIPSKQSSSLQDQLEWDLKNVIEFYCQDLSRAFSKTEKEELLALLQFSENQKMTKEGLELDPLSFSPFLGCESGEDNIFDLATWRLLASLLLTEKNEFRKTVTVAQGFPAPSSTKNQDEKAIFSEMKERMKFFLEKASENPNLQNSLLMVRYLPNPEFSEKTWSLLKALLEVLPIASGLLKCQFQQSGMVDFVEIAEGALKALGEEDSPSSLLLKLDYKISHLLVDEFQDTSFVQSTLLQKLTAGWQENDGRSLFLVGDPMQSIYRFRQAEVGLFIAIQQTERFNQIPIQSLQLKANYRSDPELIEWFNSSFKNIFPRTENIALGSVLYKQAVAGRPDDLKVTSAKPAVSQYWFYDAPLLEEALKTAELLKTLRQENPKDSICVLVRARQHLSFLLPLLRQTEIPFLAVDIEPLSKQPVVHDLLALLRALMCTMDSVAWYSILRAPWCGISLVDLTQLAQNTSKTVWQTIQDPAVVSSLSKDAQPRIMRLTAVLADAFDVRYRLSLADWLKQIWMNLKGPACLLNLQEIKIADHFFEFLQKEVSDKQYIDFHHLEEKLAKIFIPPLELPDNPIQIMTIHRSKGLEFDHVVIPGMGRIGQAEKKQLLLWLEHPTLKGSPALVMAPVEQTEVEHSLYTFLKYQNALKADFELSRLFYVAVTRAKKSLTLLGSFVSASEDKAAVKSFLSMLAPTLKPTSKVTVHKIKNLGNDFSVSTPGLSTPPLDCSTRELNLKRFSSDFFNDKDFNFATKPLQSTDFILEDSLEENIVQHIGILLHRIFKMIAEEKMILDERLDFSPYRRSWEHALQRLGVGKSQISYALQRIDNALTAIKIDPKAQWILYPHSQAFCELPVVGNCEGKLITGVIDRTFVDEKGDRWIIDYKMSNDELAQKEDFLVKKQALYKPQLEKYAGILSNMSHPALLSDISGEEGATLFKRRSPIRLGLYFPLMKAWCEWEAIHSAHDKKCRSD